MPSSLSPLHFFVVIKETFSRGRNCRLSPTSSPSFEIIMKRLDVKHPNSVTSQVFKAQTFQITSQWCPCPWQSRSSPSQTKPRCGIGDPSVNILGGFWGETEPIYFNESVKTQLEGKGQKTEGKQKSSCPYFYKIYYKGHFFINVKSPLDFFIAYFLAVFFWYLISLSVIS